MTGFSGLALSSEVKGLVTQQPKQNVMLTHYVDQNIWSQIYTHIKTYH